MTPQTAKAKGRKFQQDVSKLILKYFTNLEQDDVVSRPMGSPGEDLMLSPLARRTLRGISIEAKNQESLNIWKALEQSESRDNTIPIVVFKRNRTKAYVALEFEKFLGLLKELHESTK